MTQQPDVINGVLNELFSFLRGAKGDFGYTTALDEAASLIRKLPFDVIPVTADPIEVSVGDLRLQCDEVKLYQPTKKANEYLSKELLVELAWGPGLLAPGEEKTAPENLLSCLLPAFATYAAGRVSLEVCDHLPSAEVALARKNPYGFGVLEPMFEAYLREREPSGRIIVRHLVASHGFPATRATSEKVLYALDKLGTQIAKVINDQEQPYQQHRPHVHMGPPDEREVSPLQHTVIKRSA